MGTLSGHSILRNGTDQLSCAEAAGNDQLHRDVQPHGALGRGSGS